MQNILKTLLLLPLAIAPAFAGGMRLEVGSAKTNPAAIARHGIVLARLTACQNPAKADLTVTAEGMVNGKRQSIPVKADLLSEPGTWSIARAWPSEGKWVVRIVATHPEYGIYASSVLAVVDGDMLDQGKVKNFSGQPPTPADVAAILAK